MLKEYVICHADPFAIFAPWQAAFKIREWHTHPLTGSKDAIVTLELMAKGVRDDLDALEADGKIMRLPTLASGDTITDAIAKHPTFVAAGITNKHRTWDAAKILHKFLAWPPLHPER